MNENRDKDSKGGDKDLEGEIEALKTAQAVSAAAQTGQAATMAATQAGQAATTAAAFMGTWSTIAVGAGMLLVGIFLGLSLNHR